MTPQYVEYRSVHKLEEIIQKLSRRGQRPKHTGVQAWDIEGTVRRINIYVIEVPERGERENGMNNMWSVHDWGLSQDDERHHGTNSKSAEAQASSVETKSYLSKWK